MWQAIELRTFYTIIWLLQQQRVWIFIIFYNYHNTIFICEKNNEAPIQRISSSRQPTQNKNTHCTPWLFVFFRYSSRFETFERYFISFPTHYLDTEVHNIPLPSSLYPIAYKFPKSIFSLLSNAGDLIDSFSFFSILLVVLDSFCALLLYFFAYFKLR